MMLHECSCCEGTGEVDYYLEFVPEHYDAVYKSDGEKHECPECKGKGEVDWCQCSVWEPSECLCGAWDDADVNE